MSVPPGLYRSVPVFGLFDFCLVPLGHVQYCRVPKNGLPKNGQAGISPKFKNVLRLEK